MHNVLILDDDVRLAAMLVEYLGNAGLKILTAYNKSAGLQILKTHSVDVLLLDVMLPDADGMEFCKEIRMTSAIPHDLGIIMLTAKGDPTDRIIGIELGADDYLAKPFEPRELLARVRALIRRKNKFNDQRFAKIIFDDLLIDRNLRIVMTGNKKCELTSRQFDILVILASNPGRVLSRQQIMDKLTAEVETFDPSFDRSIDVHIARIRAEIEKDPKNPLIILTIRGVGYVFTNNQV